MFPVAGFDAGFGRTVPLRKVLSTGQKQTTAGIKKLRKLLLFRSAMLVRHED
jgi:hypothetical protein